MITRSPKRTSCFSTSTVTGCCGERPIAFYEGAPLILAMVIGPMMEETLRQSLLLSSGSFAILVSSPIAASFIGAALLLLVLPLLTRRRIASPEELG